MLTEADFPRSVQAQGHHSVAACLIFKDSAPYLEEWLSFHAAQGVSYFFLYNNESSDHYQAVLAPWIEAGRVELKHIAGIGVQTLAYNDCLVRARGRCEWVAFIDDDEFLFSPRGETLPEALKDYREFAGVAVPWVLFGSGGCESRPVGEAVLPRFTRSTGAPDQHVKCIVKPERVRRSLVVGHWFETKDGLPIVDEQRVPIHGPTVTAPRCESFRINHYIVKSWAEWRQRRARPQADSGKVTPHSESQWREWDRLWSEREDTVILSNAQGAIQAVTSL